MNKRSSGVNLVRDAAVIGSATLLFVSVCAEIPSAFGASMLQSQASQGSSANPPSLPMVPSEPPLPGTVPPLTNPPAIPGLEYVIPFRSPDPELAEFMYSWNL